MVSRKLTLDLTFLAMEALALFVVGAVLSGAGDYSGPPYPGYLAAELGGFFLVRALFRFELPVRLLVTIGGVISILTLVTIGGLEFDPSAFPPGWAGVFRFLGDPGKTSDAAGASVVFGTILFVIAWSRGVLVAQRRLERGMALRSFSIGLFLLLIGLVFGNDSHTRGAINAASIPFVALGLMTLGLIHLREAGTSTANLNQGPWFAIMGGTTGSLVLAGAALGVLPLGPAGYVYDHAIGPALDLALTIFAWIVIVIAFPIAWLISLILSSFVHGLDLKPQPPQQVTPDQAQKLIKHQGGAAAIFVVLVKVIVIIAVIAIVAYVAYRLFRRLHRPLEDEEERDSLRHEGSVLDDLAALWRSIRPRRPQILRGPPEPSLPPTVLEVRRLYLTLLERSALRGNERPAAATPGEFQPVLEQGFQSPVPGHLTGAFERARYGLVEPASSEVTELREGLRSLD